MTTLPITEAVGRTLMRDLMYGWKLVPAEQELIRRRLIDKLSFWRGMWVTACFCLAPTPRPAARPPWTTQEILDELDRRRSEVVA